MNLTYVIVLALGTISVMISLMLVMITALERPSKEQTRFLLTMCFVMVTCLGGLLEHTATTADAALNAAKVGYIGRIFTIMLLPRFIMEYTHFQGKEWIYKLTWGFNFIALILMMTTEHHKLFYKSWKVDLSGSFPVFRSEHAILYYLMSFEMYIIFALIVIFILWKIHEVSTKEEKMKYRGIFAGVMAPLIAVILGQLGLTWEYDPLPISLMFSCLVFLLAVKKYHLFDIEQNAKEYVLDNAKEAVLILDRNLESLYTNQTFHEFDLHYVMEEQISRNEDSWFEKGRYQFTVGDRYFEIHKTDLHHEDGTLEGYLLEIRDLTFQRNTVVEMDRLKQEAEAANISKSSFLANMSHEIRTPINAVIGMNEMILREADEKNVLEYADNIRSSGKELLSLVNDILDFSKMESGKMTILPVEYEANEMILDIVRDAKEELHALTSEQDKLSFYIKKEVPRVLYGDRNRIEQLFAGIIKNSIILEHHKNCKYEITFERIHQEESDVVDTKYPYIYLQFVITHFGVTKDKASRDRIFLHFNPEKNKNKDIESGKLSFALVDKLIGEMNGFVEAKILPDGSERFVFSIPQGIVNEDLIPDMEEMVSKQEFKVRKKEGMLSAPDAKILVVDDNVVNLKVIQGLLKRTEIQLFTAKSGKECLEKIMQEAFDLIFMDHMMPGMDGIETFHAMQELDHRCKEKPVIILTANVVAGAKEMYVAQGFTDYLMKPVNSEELENMLWEYLPKEKTSR